MTIIDNMTSGAVKTYNAATASIEKLSANPIEAQRQLMEMQMAMSTAQAQMTAASEIVKAWGEGQQAIAKNMGS